MTREEVYQKIEEIFEGADYVAGCPCICEDSFENIIDEIFNDFKNRTCKNCKWFNRKTYECENRENEQEIGNYDNVDYIFMQVDEDFGCNRFERREYEID